MITSMPEPAPPSTRGPGRRPLATACAVVAAAWLLALPVLRPSWGPNDDAVMAMIASGRGIAVAPEAHVVFSHIVIGHALAGLYAAWPGAPWYGLYLLAVLFAAHVALAWAALAAAPGRRVALAFAAYFASVGLAQLAYFSFTGVAVLAAGAGLLVAARGLHRPSASSRAAALAAGAALALLGLMIRLEAPFLALGLFGPAAWLCAARAGRTRAVFAFGAALVLLSGGLRALDASAYAPGTAWGEFRQFNTVRKRFTDYATPSPERAADALRQVGWRAADYRFLTLWWFHGDPAVYSRATLERLAALLDMQGPFAPQEHAARRLREALLDRRSLAAFLAAAALLVAARPRSVFVLAAALPAAVLLAALLWLLRAPPAVCLAVTSAPAALALALGGGPPASRSRGRLALAAALALFAAWLGVGEHRRAAAVRREVRTALGALLGALGSPPRGSVVAWAGALPFEALSPLESMGALGRLRVLVIGWPQRTPLARELLAREGALDALDLLARREDALLVAHPAVLPEIAGYLRRRRGLAVEFEEALRFPNVQVLRVRARPADAPPPPAGEGQPLAPK
jgi:hypothetical protein